jgi:hypothetical protein
MPRLAAFLVTAHSRRAVFYEVVPPELVDRTIRLVKISRALKFTTDSADTFDTDSHASSVGRRGISG